MRFFKRGRSEGDALADFWSWWATARSTVAAGIEGGGIDDRVVRDVHDAVDRLHPSMAWELAPGRTARHAFCLSPEGNTELRQHALRWQASAPPPDATWEYHAARQAAPSLSRLDIGQWQFELGEVRAISSWDGTRRRVDVRLWHPLFADAPREVRLQAAFLFLDNLLGEDDVERWIGEVDLLESPTGGRTPDELRAEVERRRKETGSDETWILAEIEGPGGVPGIVVANAALKRIDHPFADHHVTIEQHFGADRMPTDAEATTLNEEEDDFLARVGDVALYVGRLTVPGRRTMHFVAEDPDRMRPAIDGWAADLPDSLSPGLPQRRLKINFERDMDWEFQRELGVR